MKINRRSIALGLTVGLLAGGAGGALAASTTGGSTAGTPATTVWGGDGAWGGYGYGPGWSGHGPGWSGHGPGWSGHGGYPINSRYGDVGPMTFGRTAIRAAAGYLELTASGLKSRLRSDQTLADLAISRHKSVSGLESAIVAAISSSVHSDSALSAGQKAAIIADAKGRIGSIVDGTCPMGSGFGAYYGPMTSH